MAIAIEAFCVIARNETLAKRLRGGVAEFSDRVPNSTCIADDDLSSCSFMNDSDAKAFLQQLAEVGLNIEGDDPDATLFCCFDNSMRPICQWLKVAQYKKAMVAWLGGSEVKSIMAREGWDPDAEPKIQHQSAEEAAKRLKFLRREENVEVFWDSETEQEVFVGRTNVPVGQMFDEGLEIIRQHFRNPGEPLVDREHEPEVRRAIEMMQIVIEHSPDVWNAHLLLGKAWQSLGDYERAYAAFTNAYQCDKEVSMISRELAGACLELGRTKQAVEVAEHAVALEPDNPELLGNLALAYLVAHRTPEAQSTISAAIELDSSDNVNRYLQSVIAEVSDGKRPTPAKLSDLMK